MHLIEKSQGERATLIGSPALLVDSGRNDSANCQGISGESSRSPVSYSEDAEKRSDFSHAAMQGKPL